MDMWRAFRNSVRTQASQAQILFDTLHVLRHLADAMGQVPRAEYKRVAAKDRAFIKGQRYTLLSHRANLTLLASSMPLQYNAQKGNAMLERFPRKYREEITSVWSANVAIIANRELIMQVTANSLTNKDWEPVCEYYLRPYDRWAMRRAQIMQ